MLPFSKLVALGVSALLLASGCTGGDSGGTRAAPGLPAAPPSVVATPGDGQATLAWPAVAGATTYNLYWSTTPGVTKASGAKLAGVTTPYLHAGLANGVVHYWIVTAGNAAGESVASPQASAMPSATPAPPAPATVMATPGDLQVTVSWSASSGATSYNLYWSTSSAVSQSNGTKIASATSPYLHGGLVNGTAYHYVVTAVNANGESTDSPRASATPAAAPPPAPSGVVATAGDGQVTVSWPAVAGAASYDVYWSTTAGVTTANGTRVAGASRPFVHTGLSNGTRHYYVVTAVNAGGASPASSQVSAVPAPPLPAAPTGVTAIRGNAQVTLAWSAVGGATSYHLYYGTAAGVSTASAKLANVTSPYVHGGLANGTPYYYVVTAANMAGESAVSVEVSATPAANVPPAAPTGVVATAGDQRVTISWPPVAGANTYRVYWSQSQGASKASPIPYTNAVSPFTVNGLMNGGSYYFVVTAVGGYGESAESIEVMGVPMAPGRTISGTVSYGGGKSGRVYVNTVCQSNCYDWYYDSGTSVDGPGSFQIRGVPPGTYTLRAYMDTLGEGVANASFPAGRSAAVAVSTADVPGADVTLVDPGVAAPRPPTGLKVHPGAGGALVFWDQVYDPANVESVTGYRVAWGTDPAASTGGGTLDLVARGDTTFLPALSNGFDYYFKVASKAGPTVSGWSAVVGPVTVGPGAGGITVSGIVTFPGTATGPLWIILQDPVRLELYVVRIASPVSPQAYSTAGLPVGTFYVLAFLDQNGSATLDLPDLRNWTNADGPPTVTLTGDATVDVDLPARGTAGSHVQTWHEGVGALETFGIYASTEDGTRLVVAAALVSGPGISGPVDLARSYGGYSFRSRRTSTRPAVATPYRLALTYGDGTTENVDLTAEVLELPRDLAAAPTPVKSVPTFYWSAPATLPASSFGYALELDGADRSWTYPPDGLMPSTQRSVVYDVDGGARTNFGDHAASLSLGVPYTWKLSVRDAMGNTATRSAEYTPAP